MIAGLLGLVPCVLVVLAAIGLFLMKLTHSMALSHSPDFAGLDIVPILAQAEAPRAAEGPLYQFTKGEFVWVPPVLLYAALQVPASILMILGGRKMRRLETYGLAVFAGIVALLPTGPVWIISMPIGIWALIVLAGPEVREGFRSKRGGKTSAGRSPSSTELAAPPIPAKSQPVDEWKLVSIKQQLFWPGLGLAGGGGIGLASVLLSCLAAATIPLWMPPPSDGLVFLGASGIVALIGLQIASSLLIIVAGLKMMRLESYRWALTGAWLALLPIGPASILTMPLAIWALVLLSSNDVRDAFGQKAAR